MDCSMQIFDNSAGNSIKMVSFPEVCQYIRGLTYNKSQEVDDSVVGSHKVLRANNITLGTNSLNFEDVKHVSNDVTVKATQWLKKGDILMCASSGSQEHVGKVAFIEQDMPYTFGGFMAVIRCESDVLPQYMFYVLTSGLFANHLKEALKSNTIKTINATAMNSFSFPVPSIGVQKNIVQILDEYLETNNQLVETLQQELVARKRQYDFYREKLMESKEGWTQSTLLEALCQAITDGPHETPTLVEHGVPFISAEALTNNAINFDLKRGYISEEYDEICCKKYKPQLGDIYMCKSGSTTGKVAMVETSERFNIWSPLAAIRVDPMKVLPRYMFFYLQTSKVQNQVLAKSSKGSQPNLSMRKLEQFEVAYPEISEQEKIISVLDECSNVYSQYISSLENEIKFRKKQYEYYRDKLLSFEEAN